MAALSRSSCDSARSAIGVVLGLGAQLLALGPRGLDLLVARALGGAHQQRGLLVGVDHDGGGLLGRTGEHLLGLLARPAGLGAVGLGLGSSRRASSRRTARSAVSRSASSAGLGLQLVGHLLRTGQQGSVVGSPEEAVAASRAMCPLPSRAFREAPRRHCGSATASVTKGSHTGCADSEPLVAARPDTRWSGPMKLLVLGGTRFLSRETATQAVARGWDVTCACRGESGPVPDGATHLPWDRADDAPAALADGDWDAVVDVTRLPSHARRAVAASRDAHWVFVSTISVYPDNSSPAMEPLAEPITEDVDLAVDPEAYGGMKVACEQAVQELAASSVDRPPRAHRRARRPDRPVRLLAAAAGPRRRGAGARDARRRRPGHRRTRPRGLAARPRRVAYDRGLRRGRPPDAVRRDARGRGRGRGQPSPS